MGKRKYYHDARYFKKHFKVKFELNLFDFVIVLNYTNARLILKGSGIRLRVVGKPGYYHTDFTWLVLESSVSILKRVFFPQFHPVFLQNDFSWSPYSLAKIDLRNTTGRGCSKTHQRNNDKNNPLGRNCNLGKILCWKEASIKWFSN